MRINPNEDHKQFQLVLFGFDYGISVAPRDDNIEPLSNPLQSLPLR
jgi:hypothetical protein